ncbi:MAG: hypothetical protein HC924_02020 [Synechococcaceae cyanobacterium SM2_3_2]|nr:hypothetical protein [Synechococcaceae cyanobacterium SM2_3_2]
MRLSTQSQSAYASTLELKLNHKLAQAWIPWGLEYLRIRRVCQPQSFSRAALQ